VIIFDGDGDAISFNDDRSLDSRKTDRVKVYVNGQVDRSLSLDWFYKLLWLFPDLPPGELKSAIIVAKFKDLPSEIRDNVWRSLHRVRIHIVDPRTYLRRVENLLRELLDDDFAADKLRRKANDGDFPSRYFLSQMQNHAAESLLNDSAAFRAERYGRLMSRPFFLEEIPLQASPFSHRPTVTDTSLLTVEDFRHGHDQATIRNIAQWSAKAAAAFHSALDAIESRTDDNEAEIYRFDMGRGIRTRMIQALRPSHAFDKGNAQHMGLLERSRDGMMDTLSANDAFFSAIARPSKYVELESKSSYYVQAADFAAGIATDIYTSEKLIGVVRRFEYVTFNGRRVSRSDAEEEMRKKL
jgi:hypothetical protein